jgi:hypothetical protein
MLQRPMPDDACLQTSGGCRNNAWGILGGASPRPYNDGMRGILGEASSHPNAAVLYAVSIFHLNLSSSLCYIHHPYHLMEKE